MASLDRFKCIETWKSQNGYSSGSSKSSIYSKELDSVSFYNSRKNGYANWCAIFFDWGIYKCTEPEPNASDARAFVYEPNRDNCGAGCKQKVDYYKAHNAWYPHKAKGCPAKVGDEIFFADKSYVSKTNPYGVYHTGAVIDWDSGGIYTIEGNINGGKVGKRYYKYSDSKIYGFGRPDYTEEDVKPEPTPEPTPEPEPTTTKYRVSTYGGTLTLRGKPNKSSTNLANIPNGTILEVDEIVKGESINYNTNWAHTSYKGKTGYVSCYWIKKI